MLGVYIALAVVGSLVLLRLFLGLRAERRLRACLKAYRAAGQPVEPQDFTCPHVPSGQNAANLLREADEKIVKPRDPKHPFYLGTFDLSQVADDLPSAKKLIDDNRFALELVERACRLPVCEWNCIPTHDALFVETFPIRRLVRMLVIAAFVAQREGRVTASLCYLRQAQQLANWAYDYPIFVGLMIAVRADASVSFAIEFLAPELRLEPDHVHKRRLAQELIDFALDEAPLWHARSRVFFGDRAFKLDHLRAVRAGALSAFRMTWPSHLPRPNLLMRLFYSPRWTRLAVPGLEHLTRVAIEQDSSALLQRWREYRLPDHASVVQQRRRWRRALDLPDDGPYTALNMHALFASALARRRMAAVALALRLFHADQGRLPDALAELVPQYLPHVPLDPLAPAPAEIHYRPMPEPPVLYSVGRDGMDNGGRIALDEKGLPVTEGSDDLFYLRREDRPRRPLPPLHVEPGDTLRGEGGVSI